MGGGAAQEAQADTSDLTYAPTSPPNILVVMVDQLRYLEFKNSVNHLGDALPNLTAFRNQCVEFTNFFVAGTSCTPSRAAFVTGLYPTQTCMYVTQGSSAAPSLQTSFPTFASYLESIGYQTAYYGKWHLSNESADTPNPDFSSYGFTITGNESPSPDGFANEGSTGGTFANPPHQGSSGNWINDQQIVRNFAQGLQALATTSPLKPWCAVVSLINPHDISDYPLYQLNYCSIVSSPIKPYYPPQTPGAAPTWAVSGSGLPTNPNLPVLQRLFTHTAPTGAPTCSPAPQPFTTYGGTILTPNSVPSNTTEAIGPPKPSLQSAWYSSQGSLLGYVDAPSSSPTNGDWGQMLNVYYWMAGCADQLIGSLSSPDSHIIQSTDPSCTASTILGQYAALLTSSSPLTGAQKLSFGNTIIVFTSDHGELGGAHNLMGKSACSYDEAIQVPLFIHIPGVTNANYTRTQLVSSVDFFGLICGLAQQTYNPSGVPTWQAANPQLSTRADMLKCIQSNSYVPTGRTITIGGVATPYIMHTYNDYFRSTYDPNPWDSSDPFHVVCLRTAAEKLVYYDVWSDTSTPPQAQFNASHFDTTLPAYASSWTTGNGEYYNLSTNPTETGNAFVTSPLKDIQVGFMSCVTNELQANPSSISSAISAATSAFQSYVTAPSAIVVPGPITHSASPQVITFTGTNVQAGPTAEVQGPFGYDTVTLLDDLVTSPFPLTLTLLHAGSYTITVTNPSGLTATGTFTVS